MQHHPKHIHTGIAGEDAACGYLEGKGYKILHRNFRSKFGELDIVCISPDKTLCFIEVKSLSYQTTTPSVSDKSYPHFSGNTFSTCGYPMEQFIPEDHFTPHKLRLFRNAALWFSNDHPDLSRRGYRLDLITVRLARSDDSVIDVRHYENIADTTGGAI